MLDRNPGKKLSDLKGRLPRRLHLADHEPALRRRDEVRHRRPAWSPNTRRSAKAGGKILGRKIVDVITVNGVRVTLEDGSWVLVRASSNKPEIVVVVESTQSEDDMRALFREEVKPRLAKFPEVGAYNQEI